MESSRAVRDVGRLSPVSQAYMSTMEQSTRLPIPESPLLGLLPVSGIPEDVAKERLKALIAIKREQQAVRQQMRTCLFTSAPWVKEIRHAFTASQKKEDIIQQLNQLVAALQNAEDQEKAGNARLRFEFEDIYAQYKDQHDQLTAQLQETPLVTQEVNFHRERRPHKMTRHPVFDNEFARSRDPDSVSSSRVMHDFQRSQLENIPSMANGATPCARGCWVKDQLNKIVDRPKLVCSAPATQMLRTVYMPNEHADLLVLTMESLAMQLEDQEQMCNQKARMMSEMRHTRALEHKKRMLVNKDTIKMLRRSIRIVRKQTMERQRDLLLLQQKLQKQTEEFETERLVQVKELILSNNLRDHAMAELQQKQDASKSRYDWYKKTMNMESETRQGQFEEIKQRYTELQRLYKARIEGLEREFSSERSKVQQLQEQRKFVIEQLVRQVADLRSDVQLLQIEARTYLFCEERLGLQDSSLFEKHLLTDAKRAAADEPKVKSSGGNRNRKGTEQTRLRARDMSERLV